MAHSKTNTNHELSRIVGIGASADGSKALEDLFKYMPHSFGCAFIIVHNLPPDLESLLGDSIVRQTDITVLNAEDGMRIKPDHIYISPSNTQILIEEDKFKLSQYNNKSYGLTCINDFFKSLASGYGSKAIAIMLADSVCDCSKGVIDVHQQGGCVICQDLSSSQFNSMPRNGKPTECVDATLPPHKIPMFIQQYLESPTKFKPDDVKVDENSRMQLVRIITDHLGIDFSHYKEAAITRGRLHSPHPNSHPIDSEFIKACDILLSQHIPPCVLLSSSGEALHYFGDVQKYLSQRQDSSSNAILDKVSGQLKTVIATLIQRINTGEQRVEYKDVVIPHTPNVSINLIAESIDLKRNNNKLLLTFFPAHSPATDTEEQHEQQWPLASETYHSDKEMIRRIQGLEAELSISKKNLQARIEELQATKEELRSVNKELSTVNSKCMRKNEQLLELNAEHQAILDSVDIGIVVIDSSYCIRKFNRALLNILQPSPQDIGRSIDHLAPHLKGIQKLTNCTTSAITTGAPSGREVTTLTGAHYSMRIYPVKQAETQCKGAILTFASQAEVKEAKTAQIALEESRMLYRSIVEDQGSLICRFEPDFTINYLNRAFAKFFASDSDQIVGSSLIDLLKDEDRSRFQRSIESLQQKAPISKYIKTYPDSDGDIKWIEWTDRAFFDSHGKLIGYQTIGRDITQLKESEEQLRKLLTEAEEARKTAEDANKAKSEFLAVMNHELRTPLNPIIAGSELLAEIVEANDEQYTMAKMIHSAGEHLLSLINSVLDLSKLEAEKITPVMSLLSPSEIIEKVTQFFIPLAQQKNLAFSVDIAKDLPERIISDSFIIRQILINIIGNALKFTRQGTIHIHAWFEKETHDGPSGNFKISVKDTGIGIPPAMQEKIFDPFYQANRGISREFGGTGIGLAISKQSVQLLGGDIFLQSKEDIGSEFTLSVPATIDLPKISQKKQAEATLLNVNLEGITVLVVDDDPLNRQTIRGLVAGYVDDVDTADGGNNAMRHIHRKKYDIVLMDVHMPHMDGFQTARAIKKEFKEKAPRIIYVTADNRELIGRKAMEQHYGSAFISKPLRGKILLETMSKVISAHGPMAQYSEIGYLED